MTAHTKKMATIFSFFIIIAVAIGISAYITKTAVSRSDAAGTSDITPDSVTATIISDLKYTDITKIQQDQLIKHYSIPDGLVTNFSLYMSKSATQSFEIACFELTNQDDFDKLKQIIAEHITAKAENFKGQSPVEYEKIQKFVLKKKGRFVFLAISDDADAAAKIFISMIG